MQEAGANIKIQRTGPMIPREFTVTLSAADPERSPPQGDESVIHIRELDHIVLRVVDLDKMLWFYCGALGCSVERRQEEIGLIQLRAGRSLIDLVPVNGKLGSAGGAAPGVEGRNLDHFCLRVEPFDAEAIRGHHSGEWGNSRLSAVTLWSRR